MALFGRDERPAAKAEKILADLGRIDEARIRSANELKEARAAQVAAETDRAVAEASAAIGEEVDLENARTNATRAAQKVADLIARVDALAARRRIREDELLGIEDALLAERAALRDQRIATWDKKFRSLAAQLRAAAIEGLALCEVSGAHFEQQLRDARLPDPTNPAQNLLDMECREFSESSGWTEVGWRGDTAAAKFAENLFPIFTPFDAAGAELKKIREARHAEEEVLAAAEYRRKLGVAS